VEADRQADRYAPTSPGEGAADPTLPPRRYPEQVCQHGEAATSRAPTTRSRWGTSGRTSTARSTGRHKNLYVGGSSRCPGRLRHLGPGYNCANAVAEDFSIKKWVVGAQIVTEAIKTATSFEDECKPAY